MDTLFQAETITSYALGQRRGFVLGFVCGAAFVIYTTRYRLVRRSYAETIETKGQKF